LFSIRALKKGFCVGGQNKVLSIYELDKTFSHNLVLGSNVALSKSSSKED